MNRFNQNIAVLTALSLLCTLAKPSAAGNDEIDCLAIIRKEQQELSYLLTEDHCKKTAEHVINLLAKKGLIKPDDTSGDDLKYFFTMPMGKKLFATSDSPEHVLFSINVCGGGHVFITEKKSKDKKTNWRILQSWQKEFTLAQWLGVQKWVNTKFNKDFDEYGNGKALNQEQLKAFITQQVSACSDKMRQFREAMLPEPYELVVSSLLVKKAL